MKNRAEILMGVVVLFLLVALCTARQAMKLSTSGKFPFFSMATLEGIWPYLIVMIVAIALTFLVKNEE